MPPKTLSKQKYSSTTNLGLVQSESQFFTTKIMKSNSSCKFILPKNSNEVKKAVESSLERLKDPEGHKTLNQIPMLVNQTEKTNSSTPDNSQSGVPSKNKSNQQQQNSKKYSPQKKMDFLPSRFNETYSKGQNSQVHNTQG